MTEAEVGEGRFELSGEPAGRQMWHYAEPKTRAAKESSSTMPFDAAANPNSADLLFRAQRLAAKRTVGGDAKGRAKGKGKADAGETAEEAALRKGIAFYEQLQCDDGHWAGDYGGPHFLMPGLITTWYVTGKQERLISPPKARAMMVYLRNHQQSDGGWGTHIESPSTMFGTTLNYVALRLLGVDRDDPAMVKGRAFIHSESCRVNPACLARVGSGCLA